MGMTRRTFLKLSGITILSLSLPNKLLSKEIEIPVLLYHDISDEFRDEYTTSPSVFAAHMEWLYSNGYKALSFKEINNITTVEKAVIITFDDGYASFMDYVFPLLKEYRFKAIINIIGQYVGSFITEGGNRPMLSWSEYRYLIKNGNVELGCHTYNLHVYRHKGASGVSEKVLDEDLSLFQKTLKKETGITTEILAWPYGLYDEKSIRAAKKAGIRYILTSKEGYATFGKSSDFNQIPRLNINNTLDLTSFKTYIGAKI